MRLFDVCFDVCTLYLVSCVGDIGTDILSLLVSNNQLQMFNTGDDLRLDLVVPFRTSIFGGEEKVRISHLENCKVRHTFKQNTYTSASARYD
jgi:hypothetical protein